MSTTSSMARSKVAVFAVVAQNGSEPLYLRDLKSSDEVDSSHMYQFVLHASLDMVGVRCCPRARARRPDLPALNQEKQWHTSAMYLGPVESFRDNVVSAWVMANGTNLLLLNRGFPEASVKAFLKTMHTVILGVCVNPLARKDAPINDAAFDAKVSAAAATHLR
jgi:hypothetical protein